MHRFLRHVYRSHMQRKFSMKKLAFLVFFISAVTFGQHNEEKPSHTTTHKEQNATLSLKEEFKKFKEHHIQDSYSFDLLSYKNDKGEKVHWGFPLPVILWDNGLKIFSSSKFHYGETVATVGENHYKLYHAKIYKTDAHGTINLDDHHHPTNVKPLDFSITKSIFFVFTVGLLMFFVFRKIAKSYKKSPIPTGLGRFLEPLILFIRDDIAIPNIGKKHYKKYMNFLLTIFFFIWIINLLGLTPLGVNVTNNIAITFVLAIMTYLFTTFTANKNYWKHIFWMPGVPVPMKILLAPIELLGTIIKPFALMIRLYANITAGHIVLMSVLGMMVIANNWLGSSLSFVLAFVLSLLELLVAALQAYIFTMLSSLYFGMAVEEHDEH